VCRHTGILASPVTTGVEKAITPDRFDDRDDKALTQDRAPLEA